MKRILFFVAIVTLPALSLFFLFDHFNIGIVGSRLVVSLCFGLVLSTYFLLRFSKNKRNATKKEEDTKD